jgi:hypothetical protein
LPKIIYYEEYNLQGERAARRPCSGVDGRVAQLDTAAGTAVKPIYVDGAVFDAARVSP